METREISICVSKMEDFCYLPSLGLNSELSERSNFTSWHHQYFGICFLHLTFLIPLHATFAVLNTYFTGAFAVRGGKWGIKRKQVPSIVMVRLLVAFLLLLAPVVELASFIWQQNGGYSYAQLMYLIVATLAWLSHVIYLLNISRSVRFVGRGPILLNLSWYLTFVSIVLLFWSQIRYVQSPLTVFSFEALYFSLLPRAFAIIAFSLHIVYCLTLLVPVSEAVSKDDLDIPASQLWSGSTQNRSDPKMDESERQYLLSSNSLSSPIGQPADEPYGSISIRKLTKKKQVIVSEEGANLLSKLTFWWFQPLMSKGARGEITSVKDLPVLPSFLQTSLVRESFQRIWQRTTLRQSPPVETGCEGVHIQGEFPPRPASVPQSPSTRSPQHETKRGEVGDNYKSKKITWKGMTLFWSLNRAFGCQYYSLGLLKLLVNVLSFAGPVLLQYLVTFMEERTMCLLVESVWFCCMCVVIMTNIPIHQPRVLHISTHWALEPIQNGYFYAVGMVLGVFLNAFLRSHYLFLISKVGLKFRAATITLIYHKALSVNLATLSLFSTGEITNFMSVDANRIVNYVNSFHEFWSLPIQIVVSLVLLYLQVGLSFLGGVVVALLLIPVNRWLAKKIGKLTEDMMAHKDSRVKTITEMLFGIRVIKLCAWEDVFAQKINRYRAKELNSLKYRKYLDAGCVYFWATTPIIISIVTFVTYSLLGNRLTASKVFTSLSLFSILIAPLNAYPWVINGMVEAWVSLKRVQRFLNLKETNKLCYYDTPPFGHSPSIKIEAGRFSWQPQNPSTSGKEMTAAGREMTAAGREMTAAGKEMTAAGKEMTAAGKEMTAAGKEMTVTDKNMSETGEEITATGEEITATGRNVTASDKETHFRFQLQDISLDVKPGQLVGVVGKVGSGKTSLLAALTAEVNKHGGSVFVQDLEEGLSLVTQVSWIQHATLRDNILFGQDYNPEFYQEVIRACALEPDLQILPAGDLTEVGENGVTLSGGQKMRVALARAMYQDKSIYLLDDPFAAVDAHVATHIFNFGIDGLLKHKTRILCTHHVRFLQKANVVIQIEDGRVSNIGPPDVVLPQLKLSSPDEEEDHSDMKQGENPTIEATLDPTSKEDNLDVLVEEEEREVDVIKPHVYWSYFTSVGFILAPTIGVFLFLMEASKDVTNWWLAYWVSTARYLDTSKVDNMTAFNGSTVHPSPGPTQPMLPAFNVTPSGSNLYFYIGIYLGLAVANSVFALFRAFLFAYGGLCAARGIHNQLLRSIMRAPIVFFDTNPIGRIVNRFSSDVFTIDDSLPFQLNIFLAQIFGLVGALATVCYGLPWIALLLIPLTMLYYKIQGYYRWTSRELKRFSSVTLSPIYAHFTETLVGLQVIRAFNHTDRFVCENELRLDTNQRAFYGTYAASYWLSLRLQLIGVFIITAVAFMAMLEHHLSFVDPGLVGLAISYSLSINSFISQVVVAFSETEKEMVSVERAVQYIRSTPAEKEEGTQEVPRGWPQRGEIEFSRVVLIYRPGLPPALREVSVTFRAGEKIGVVGRTGAGKSSLFQALFRTVEPASGAVYLDGIDISNISLKKLRSAMAIIPQDPFLFTGTVRYNIDPLEEHTDEELWSALRHSHLTGPIQTLGGLDGELGERGKELSAGQRQLLCLARALVSNAKVICVDEATASIDMETDELIQNTLKRDFANNTVITIAHRIDTVVSCDRILVMDRGRVREYDTPHRLLRDQNSLFYAIFTESRRQ